MEKSPAFCIYPAALFEAVSKSFLAPPHGCQYSPQSYSHSRCSYRPSVKLRRSCLPLVHLVPLAGSETFTCTIRQLMSARLVSDLPLISLRWRRDVTVVEWNGVDFQFRLMWKVISARSG